MWKICRQGWGTCSGFICSWEMKKTESISLNFTCADNLTHPPKSFWLYPLQNPKKKTTRCLAFVTHLDNRRAFSLSICLDFHPKKPHLKAYLNFLRIHKLFPFLRHDILTQKRNMDLISFVTVYLGYSSLRSCWLLRSKCAAALIGWFGIQLNADSYFGMPDKVFWWRTIAAASGDSLMVYGWERAHSVPLTAQDNTLCSRPPFITPSHTYTGHATSGAALLRAVLFYFLIIAQCNNHHQHA